MCVCVCVCVCMYIYSRLCRIALRVKLWRLRRLKLGRCFTHASID